MALNKGQEGTENRVSIKDLEKVLRAFNYNVKATDVYDPTMHDKTNQIPKAAMTVNFMCQLGQSMMPSCLVKHQSRCCSERILPLKSVDCE